MTLCGRGRVGRMFWFFALAVVCAFDCGGARGIDFGCVGGQFCVTVECRRAKVFDCKAFGFVNVKCV